MHTNSVIYKVSKFHDFYLLWGKIFLEAGSKMKVSTLGVRGEFLSTKSESN